MDIVKILFFMVLVAGCANIGMKDFKQAQETDTVEGYEAFLAKYPTSSSLASLQTIEAASWRLVELKASDASRRERIQLYRRHIKFYGPYAEYEGSHVALAQTLLSDLEWKLVLDAHKLSRYEWYLEQFPRGRHAELASQLIQALEMRKAVIVVTTEKSIDKLGSWNLQIVLNEIGGFSGADISCRVRYKDDQWNDWEKVDWPRKIRIEPGEKIVWNTRTGSTIKKRLRNGKHEERKKLLWICNWSGTDDIGKKINIPLDIRLR